MLVSGEEPGMVQDVVRTIGSGGDHATLVAFAAAIPVDLVAADERWIAILSNGAADPGGVVINTVCDATRYVVIRAAGGEGPGDLMNPDFDPLRVTTGKGALIDAATGDAVSVAGASTRLAVENVQIRALSGAAVTDDGAAENFRITHSVIEANSAIAAVSVRGGGAIAHSAVVQSGTGSRELSPVHRRSGGRRRETRRGSVPVRIGGRIAGLPEEGKQRGDRSIHLGTAGSSRAVRHSRAGR